MHEGLLHIIFMPFSPLTIIPMFFGDIFSPHIMHLYSFLSKSMFSILRYFLVSAFLANVMTGTIFLRSANTCLVFTIFTAPDKDLILI